MDSKSIILVLEDHMVADVTVSGGRVILIILHLGGSQFMSGLFMVEFSAC